MYRIVYCNAYYYLIRPSIPMKFVFWLTLVTLFIIDHSLLAQGPLTDNPLKTHLDSVVHRAAAAYLRQPNTVGISIGIYRNGQSYIYNYGEVKKGSKKLPTAVTFYNLGSVAKTFVGVLLAQAVVDKRAQLIDDIRQYLPGQYPNLSYQGQPVRLVNLANHTSALPKSAKTYPASVRDSLAQLTVLRQLAFYGRYNQDSLLRDMHGWRVDTLPGVAYVYNSNAMMVLSMLLGRIYQQPYEQLFANYLRTHLNMHDTKVQLSETDLHRVAQGYTSQGQAQPFGNLKGFYDGPSMNSTVHDMLKYIQANLAETDPALRLSHQLTWGQFSEGAMGLGWKIEQSSADGLRVMHSGSTGLGFNTLCTMYPAKQTGFIIFVNETTSQSQVTNLEQTILRGLN